MKVAVVFFLLFLTSNILISIFAPRIVGSSMGFPYKAMIEDFSVPKYVSAFANFDGAHYLRISDFWYQRYEQTFFPLYPIMIKLVTFVISNRLVAGLIVSYVAFLGGLFIVQKTLVQFGLTKKETLWTAAFLLLFPASFYFGAVYTESLFFFLFVSTIFLFQKKLYPPAIVCGILLGLCRLQGFLVIFALLGIALKEILKKNNASNFLKIPSILAIISPLIGTAIYSLYMGIEYKDPFLFYHSQEAFGANRSASSLILLPQVFFRYYKILATQNFTYTYLVAYLELVIFSFVFLSLCLGIIDIVKNRRTRIKYVDLLGMHIFSLTNIFLPTLTGTFSSIPRYALLSLSFFVIIASVRSSIIKIVIGACFALIHILMLSLFIQGYFVS